jgi:hypothetical protein
VRDLWIDLYRGGSPDTRAVLHFLRAKGSIHHRNKNGIPKLERALTVILRNLEDLIDHCSNSVELASAGLALSKRTTDYTFHASCDKFHRGRWVSYRFLERGLKILVDLGLITIRPGKRAIRCGAEIQPETASGRGLTTTIYPTDRLISMLRDAYGSNQEAPANAAARTVNPHSIEQDLPDTYEEDYIPNFGEVRLRKRGDQNQKKQIDLAVDLADPAVQQILSELREFNEANSKHTWSISAEGTSEFQPWRLGWRVSGTNRVQISKKRMIYNRVFSDGRYDRGGRYFADATNIPRWARASLKVNGETVVEADFKSLHLRIAYDLAGYEAPVDCFDVSGTNISRSIYKCVLLCILNMRNGKRGLHGAINGTPHAGSDHTGSWPATRSKMIAEQEYKRRHGLPYDKTVYGLPEQLTSAQINQAVDLAKRNHAKIAENYFFKDRALEYQYLDSQIATYIAKRFAAEGWPLHILHDGFFTAARFREELVEVMGEAYRAVIGKDIPPIAIKVENHANQ